MNKLALADAIDEKYRFVLEVDERFELGYLPTELRWLQLKRYLVENIETLNTCVNDYWDQSISDPWQTLLVRIEELEIQAPAESENIADWLSGQLDYFISYRCQGHSEEKGEYRIFSLKVSSASVKDSRFGEILAFMEWASARCVKRNEKCSSAQAASKFVTLMRHPQRAYSGISDANPEEKLPPLFLLLQEIAGSDIQRAFLESSFKSSISQFESSQKELQEADRVFRDEFSNLEERMGSFQEQTESWGKELQREIGEWKDKQQEDFTHLGEVYREQLALKEPNKVWNAAAVEHEQMAKKWALITAGAASGTLCLSGVGVVMLRTGILPEFAWLSPSFVLVALITFLVYVIRVFIKLTLSKGHLAAAYRQKAAMTYFYLTLLERKDAVTSEERALVLNALFSSVDTGLVKSGDSAGLDALAASLLKRP